MSGVAKNSENLYASPDVQQEAQLEPTSVAEIFQRLGGTTEVARALGVGPSTVSEMKRRGRIPAEHWLRVIEISAARGLTGVSAATLVRLHARHAGGRAPQGLAADAVAGQAIPTGQGHFTKHAAQRRGYFINNDEITRHVSALRDEWGRR